MDIVLETIKKLIGFDPDYTAFDIDLTLHINSAIDTAKQLGADVRGHLTLGGSETWSDIFGDTVDIDAIKVYIYLKCKLVFDPPGNSFLVESIKEQIREYEYRLNWEIEYCASDPSGEGVNTTDG